MKINAQKQAILNALAQTQERLSLPELLARLGSTFTERSTRRWLQELSQAGYILKTGQKRGTLYGMGSLASSLENPIFSNVNLLTLSKIRRPLFERDPVPYHIEWLDAYQPNKDFYLSQEERAALHAAGKQAALEPAGTFARKIYNRLLIDLSYNSSRLEGNTYSLLETEKLIIEGVAPSDKLTEEKVMILNHKEAIRHLVDRAPRLEINPAEICTLHYLLSDGLVPPQYAGKLRDHSVRISASTYFPLDEQNRLQEQLRKICTLGATITDPFEQSFFLLTHIAYLQAFTDVNKRTSRLSANIPLIQHNLTPLSFNAIDKDDYASALIAIYELNDTGPLTDLYLFSYQRTCQEYKALSANSNFDETRIRFREERRALLQEIILKNLHQEALERRVQTFCEDHIPDLHRASFQRTLHEDLAEMTESRIAGLGIDLQQFHRWQLLTNLRNRRQFDITSPVKQRVVRT